MATVNNPLKADLDGGGHNIANVTNYVTNSGASLAGEGTTCVENVLVDALPNSSVFVSDLVGTADPTAGAGLDRNPGSMYRQASGGQFGTAALWFKTGAAPTAWTKVA